MSDALTTLLHNWRAGDPAAADRLMSTVYDELRRLAGRHMRLEHPGHTLQATALVHELYLRLFRGGPVEWKDRAHFFAVAAQILRRILVNHARDRQAAKRGGKKLRLSLTEINGVSEPCDHDMLEIDEALIHLEKVDARAARVVELRFFAGLTEPEAAEALDISLPTLKRDWAFGRAWLLRHLGS